MKWRKVWEEELIPEGLSVLLSSAPYIGKHVRVTVEEEGSECCEKWQGAQALVVRGAWVNHCAACAFCPECGKKL